MNTEHSVVYAQPMSFAPFGDAHIIGYLYETVIENWNQPNAPEGAAPITGYQYTGPREDGGTLLPCENPSDYGCVANAIIRSKFSESDEMAIHRHFVGDKVLYADEWEAYNQFCEDAKVLAKRWLGIE